MGAYEDIARRAGMAIAAAHRAGEPRSSACCTRWARSPSSPPSEPQAVSLLVLGAFGAGPAGAPQTAAGARRARGLHPRQPRAAGAARGRDLMVAALVGGIREVTASRLRQGRHAELPALAPRSRAGPRAIPGGCPRASPPRPRRARGTLPRRTAPGPLPSGPQRAAARADRQKPARTDRRRDGGDRRREGAGGADDPRDRAPRERVQPGLLRHLPLEGRGVPRRAEGRHAPGAPRHGGRVTRSTARTGRAPCGPGIGALLEYLASEPEHAHLTLVDTFAASPEALAIRERAMEGFRALPAAGRRSWPRRGRERRPGGRHRGRRRRRLAGAPRLHRQGGDGGPAEARRRS